MPGVNQVLRLRTQEAANFLNSHRVFFYTLVSLVTVSAVIINALKNYSNFYSVAIYLSKSSRSVLVLANFGVLLTLLAGHIVQRIFFGSLRANEVERLYDRLWFFITESLLAFTIFRDEFDTSFALMFGFLLFVKSFHWLASDRIEWMDQRPYPGPPLLFHFRMTILFTILWLTDCVMFLFAVEHTLSAGVGGMVLFASEYGILMASVMNTILKYLLSTYDLRRAGRRGGENAPPWENKSMWIFYIELATDFLKLTTYLVFFIIIITFYGLPLNIIRDVYITARSFITRLRALHRYQTATRNMDQRYPNATEEELTAMSDRTCIICREEMVNGGAQDPPQHPDGPNTTPKKLPCGHIFHFYCLRSWLERQQSCPTCRRNVLENPVGAAPVAGGLQPQPPQPAPGQQPVIPGPPFDAHNPQNQAQGGNNALGFIGRYMGLPQRPVNQPPNRQIVQNVNHNHGQAGGHIPGIVINYQVQYQFPRPNNENIQPPPLQQRLPVPPFPGFPGPAGIWQPWPGAAPVAQIPRDVGVPTAVQPQANPEVVLQTTPSSTAIAPSTSASTDSASASLSESSSSSEQADIPSPREAAARAALSRLSSKHTTNLSSKDVPSTSASSTSNFEQPPTISVTSASNSEQPPTTSASSTSNFEQPPPTSASSAPNIEPPRSPENTPGSRITPSLIPLFDFRQGPAPRGAVTPQQTNGNAFNTPLPHHTRPAPRMPMPPRSASNPFQHIPVPPMLGPQTQAGYSNISASQLLPPTLTDEQLAALDVVTRESIDERLRILEGVSASVYRCVDDLMRLRSALPPVNVPATPFNTGAAAVHTPTPTETQPATQDKEIETTTSARGKEKMRESSVEEPDPESSTQAQDSTSSV